LVFLTKTKHYRPCGKILGSILKVKGSSPAAEAGRDREKGIKTKTPCGLKNKLTGNGVVLVEHGAIDGAPAPLREGVDGHEVGSVLAVRVE
jgi:hypothetical protein